MATSGRNHKKRKSSKLTGAQRGMLALWGAAALLAVILLLVFSGHQHPIETEPSEATLAPPAANPYAPEDFRMVDGFMECTAGTTKTGIDVSEHQQEIDWNAVAAAGIDFAMIRVGYRGYDQGGIYEDAYARANLQGALDAGLEVGVYFFSQATTVGEAQEEAAFTLELIRDYDITYPVAFDWEWVSDDARTSPVTGRTVTDCAAAFCSAVAAADKTPCIYFNPSMSTFMYRMAELKDYAFWLAHYHDTLTYEYAVQFWQYSSTGSVPGITGNVDLNLQLPEDQTPAVSGQ